MVVLPDGAMIEMSWKQVKYINHNNNFPDHTYGRS